MFILQPVDVFKYFVLSNELYLYIYVLGNFIAFHFPNIAKNNFFIIIFLNVFIFSAHFTFSFSLI